MAMPPQFKKKAAAKKAAAKKTPAKKKGGNPFAKGAKKKGY